MASRLTQVQEVKIQLVLEALLPRLASSSAHQSPALCPPRFQCWILQASLGSSPSHADPIVRSAGFLFNGFSDFCPLLGCVLWPGHMAHRRR